LDRIVDRVVGDPRVTAQSNKNQWVDSVFNTLDLPEKIGQLLMVSVNSYADDAEIKRIESLIKNYRLGGIVFVKGGPVTQVNLTNHFSETITASHAYWHEC
jgi:hypothetical protein